MSHVGIAVLKSSFAIIKDYFSWILPNAHNPRKMPMSIKFMKLKNLILKVNKNLKLDFHVFGIENTQIDGFGCFTPNHQGAYDPVAVACTLKKPTTFISKDDNKKLPFIGKIIYAMEGIFLNRKDLRDSLLVMQKMENDLAEQNKNWIIFPEGTRVNDVRDDLLEFHKGAYKAAMKAKAPIIPTALYGTHLALSNKVKLRKYPIYVSYLKPLYVDDYKDMTVEEVTALCRSAIQEEVNRLRKLFDKEVETLKIVKG